MSHDVEIEPQLQQLQGETLAFRSTTFNNDPGQSTLRIVVQQSVFCNKFSQIGSTKVPGNQ